MSCPSWADEWLSYFLGERWSVLNLESIDLTTVKSYLNLYHDLDDALIQNVIMPSAKGYIVSFTKRTLEELNDYPEVVTAFLILCAYIYDNRSLEVSSHEVNNILKNTLGMHTFYVY